MPNPTCAQHRHDGKGLAAAYDRPVDASAAAALAGCAGLLIGAAVVLPLRREPRTSAPADPRPAGDELPAGLADVLAVLTSAAVVLDADGEVRGASAAAYALGIARGGQLVSEDLGAMARAVRRDGGIREADLDVPRGTIGTGHTAVAARVAPLGGGLVLVLVEDRTEARRLEAVRRDFTANVSHELKTPVGALILLAEAVSGASDDPDAVRRFAGRMRHEADRLSTLVKDVIDLSRLQAHDALTEPALVELDTVVVDAIDRTRLRAQAKDIRIATGGDLDVRVLGDEDLLTTAVRNLLDNAVNYSPAGTRISIGVRRVGEVAEVSVTDQGYGIPPDDLERIFERFYRVDPARSRATGGTGLGLSIVKHVIENHGGELSVWSVEGAGSTFTIRLPVAAVPSPAEIEDPVREAAT